MSFSERLRIVLSVILVGLVFSLVVDFPIWQVTVPALGSELILNVSTPWIMAGVLLLATAAGVESLVRSHPLGEKKRMGYRTTLWGLPFFVVLLSIFLLNFLSPSPLAVIGAVVFSGGLLGYVLWGQFHTLDPQDRYFAWARQSLRFLVYFLALVFYVGLYGLKVRSLLSATGVGVLSMLLATEILREEDAGRTWGYAVVIGLAVGEVTWALNYWGIGALPGGGILLLAFYILTGLAREQVRGRLKRRVIVEFALVAALALFLLFRAFPLSW